MSWIKRTELPCKICNVLHDQLEYERARNKELTETLVSLLKPQPIVVRERDETSNKTPIPIGTLWSQRRAALEEADRKRAELLKNSNLVGREDDEVSKVQEIVAPKVNFKSTEELETELGIVDSEAKGDS